MMELVKFEFIHCIRGSSWQYIAFDTHVEVSGVTVRAIAQAMGDRSLHVLAKHGLEDVKPDYWYPQQAWLDAFYELAQGDFSATLDLVSIGMRIPEAAIWPSGVKTVEDALFSIDEAYQMAHRNGEIGSYHVRVVGEGEAVLVCENPYPCDFDYGLIYSAARGFLPPRTGLTVVHDDHAPCRKKGDDSCTYHVRWSTTIREDHCYTHLFS
jgi:hypothetical protein